MELKIFVEGGGDTSNLKSDCRKAFRELILKLGLKRMPSVIACGSRRIAFEKFTESLKEGTNSILLVDSEEIPQNYDKPWEHLKNRIGDGWLKPNSAKDSDCHLMVVTMETWLLTDKENLKVFYGSGFKEASIPTTNLETRSKAEINSALDNATRNSSKGIYHKGNHSFKLLEKTNITLLTGNYPSAKRFFDEVKTRMG